MTKLLKSISPCDAPHPVLPEMPEAGWEEPAVESRSCSHLSNLAVAPGFGCLEVDLVDGQSTVVAALASSPLKLLTPRQRGVSAWGFLASFGGGLVAGDKICFDVRIGAGARCFVGSQSSTKVYRNPNGLPCEHVTRAVLGRGSLLVCAPDPVQAFAGSHYLQNQQFTLAPDSGLVLVDWFSSGRAARGERWAFAKYQSRIEILRGRTADEAGSQQSPEFETVVLDSLLLDSAHGPLNAPLRMGRFNCLATVLLIGPQLIEPVQQILNSLEQEPVTPRSSLVLSGSPVKGGILVRIAGEHMEAVSETVRQHLAFVPDMLGDNPWARKW
ncbi:MAG: urease accessory protein UreD [Verrucomicrobia bacterium]|nr:urease accessory protein UreD [Verrucomicrobiota bacterium]